VKTQPKAAERILFARGKKRKGHRPKVHVLTQEGQTARDESGRGRSATQFPKKWSENRWEREGGGKKEFTVPLVSKGTRRESDLNLEQRSAGRTRREDLWVKEVVGWEYRERRIDVTGLKNLSYYFRKMDDDLPKERKGAHNVNIL